MTTLVTTTLVLGGARSGKSAVAEELARRHDGPIRYVATGQATDDDMRARIDVHRERRGDRFETIEAGRELVDALREHRDGCALVDSLGTWLAAHGDLRVDVDGLVASLQSRVGPTIVVSEEVGLSVHPSSDAGRRFRDALGLVNQAVASVSEEVLLVVSGRVLRLDTLDALEPGSP
jgi:adenosylcobinamide kinase/adenosylcobinamide-phosphate guanylyltransferase